VSDLTRPTLTVETGNSETSLLAYIEALEGAYAHYCRRVAPDADFDAYFQKHIYHAPFGGITWRAHRTLLRQWRSLSKDEAWQHFQRKSGAALRYVRRLGATYSASTFVGLAGLLATSDDLRDGDRISMFSYGSGSCAEFYSVRVRPGASALAAATGANVDRLLDARRRVTPAEYEQIETLRTARIEDGNYDAIDDGLDNWYDRHYRGSGRLVFTGMRDYYRHYAWS
jgi:hydroxymethylglutaryl-CoA synthase